MTEEEAKEIIKNAKPIVLPTGNTVDINHKKIIDWKNLFKTNGNSRREKSKTSNEEG